MILRRALILSARREYVRIMRDGLHDMGDDATRVDVEMDALRAMQLTPRDYDLILIDAVMEAMDGIQLLLLMKQQAPATRFVIVSDLADEAPRAQAYQNGADYYLLRPRSPAEFRTGILNMATVLKQTEEGRGGEGAEEPAQRLADVVQTRCLSGDSVILVVRGHFQSGDIFIYRGEIFHAQYPGKTGLAAFHDMLRWDEGLVRVKTFRLTNIPPRTIDLPYRRLLAGEEGSPFGGDLRPSSEAPPLDELPGLVNPTDVAVEAPALAEEPDPGPPFLPDFVAEGATPMPQVNSYWKVSLTGEIIEGSKIAEPDRSAFITTFLYRKMADVAVALEVDYFNTMTLFGPHQQQVLVADNLGVRHAILDQERTNEAVRAQFIDWCREQSF